MIDGIIMESSIPLVAPPPGWFDYDYTVLWDGDLAIVRADRDLRAKHRKWPEARLRLSKFGGGAETGAIEVSVGPDPKVDCLADGRWLVASRRAVPDENNAHLFAADGTPVGAFSLGDGISHIGCAPDNTIWVGYFDEGVFRSSPLSSSGIARFSSSGEILWSFNSESPAGLFVADCYALTLVGNALWCCPYTDFPIVRIENGSVAHWPNDIAGARALAVDGEHVLLAGGYRENADRIALVRLLDGRVQQMSEWEFPLPPTNAARLLQGLGATLHIVGQGRWAKLSLPVLRAALKY